MQIAPGGPKSSPNAANIEPKTPSPRPPEGPKDSSELTTNFKWLSRTFSSIFEPPEGVPKGTRNRGRPRLAQAPPRSDFEPIIGSAHIGTMLGPSEAHMGFMWGPRVSSSSVWVVVSGVSSFVALFRTSPRCHYASKPLNHHTSKPQRLQERGPAAWGRSP